MKQPLYEIAHNYQALQKVEDLEPDQIKDTLEGIEGEFKDKSEAIAVVDANFEADIELIDMAIKKLQARKQVIENKRKHLRDYLKFNMLATGITKISCPLFSIVLAKGIKKVHITDEKLLPDDYVTVKTVVQPDKRKLLADLKQGLDIPGAELVETEGSLRIK